MNIIETSQLDFGFTKNELFISNLNLEVPEGAIYGFLGPNGSGKTTTIRLLLGLLNSSNGRIRIFGKDFLPNKIEIFSKTGSLIEQPSLYEHLSGFDNLEITRRIRNVKKSRIQEVFKLVDLEKASRKAVKEYSLGMKQRLGLAIALLSEPKLLILDEPVNGLDPNGIIEVRELLLNLNKEFGITIFLSSHLLSEIEKIVSHLGVLSNGKLVFQGSYLALQALQENKSVMQIETSKNDIIPQILSERFPVKYNQHNQIEIVFNGKEEFAQICKSIVHAGIDIYHIELESKSLENVFLEITKN